VQSKLAKSAKEEKAAAAHSTAPAFPKIAWLALTADEIALVEVDARTTLKMTGIVLARMPRSGVVSVDVKRSKPLIASPITVGFRDGQVWIFEVPTGSKRKAKSLAAQVAATS
jgi:hypothetical protein